MPRARQLLILSVTLPALGVAPVRAADDGELDLDFRGGLAHQSYASETQSLEILARELDLRLRRDRESGWSEQAGFYFTEDLYLGSATADLGLNYFGERLELELGANLGHNSAGGLSDPLLYFDPDSLESQAAESVAYWRRSGSLGLAWRHTSWDLRTNLDYIRLDYDAGNEILSDQEELHLDGRLGLLLPAALVADLDLSLRRRRYAERVNSDRKELRLDGRLGRDLAGGELALSIAWEDHAPDNPDSVAYYERPEGWLGDLGLELLFFGDRGDWGFSVQGGRESWRELEGGYFRSGNTLDLELEGGLHLGESSVNLFAGAGDFRPDRATAEDELSRGRETRLEGSLQYALRPRGTLPVKLGLMGEELRLESDGEDRYTLLQAELELGWRPAPTLLLSGKIELYHYGSHYGGDLLPDESANASEKSVNWGLGFDWERGDWQLESRILRQARYSFLDPAADSRDWESGLWIRWHP